MSQGRSWFHWLRGGRGGDGYDEIPSHAAGILRHRAALPRKVPVKVEPKVFFANERTFLSWLVRESVSQIDRTKKKTGCSSVCLSACLFIHRSSPVHFLRGVVCNVWFY